MHYSPYIYPQITCNFGGSEEKPKPKKRCREREAQKQLEKLDRELAEKRASLAETQFHLAFAETQLDRRMKSAAEKMVDDVWGNREIQQQLYHETAEQKERLEQQKQKIAAAKEKLATEKRKLAQRNDALQARTARQEQELKKLKAELAQAKAESAKAKSESAIAKKSGIRGLISNLLSPLDAKPEPSKSPKHSPNFGAGGRILELD